MKHVAKAELPASLVAIHNCRCYDERKCPAPNTLGEGGSKGSNNSVLVLRKCRNNRFIEVQKLIPEGRKLWLSSKSWLALSKGNLTEAFIIGGV